MVRAGLRAVLRGKPSVVPGLINELAVFSVRLMPRRLQAAVPHASMNVG